MSCRRCGIPVLLTLLVLGCGPGAPKPKNAKAVFPVKGIVKIDGEPKANVNVFFTKVTNPNELPTDPTMPTTTPPSGVTDAEGKFVCSTYTMGDGLPDGDYVVTFFWTGLPPTLGFGGNQDDAPPMSKDGAKISSKYSVPSSPNAIKFTVKNQKEPQDVGVWDLTTK